MILGSGADIWFDGVRLAPDVCTIDSLGLEEWTYTQASEPEIPDCELRVVIMGPGDTYLVDRLINSVDELERAEEIGLFSHRVREELRNPDAQMRL